MGPRARRPDGRGPRARPRRTTRTWCPCRAAPAPVRATPAAAARPCSCLLPAARPPPTRSRHPRPRPHVNAAGADLFLLDLDRGAVVADLRPVLAHLGGVEAHRHDGVAAPGLRLLRHPVDHLVAAVDQVLRYPLELAAGHRLEGGTELGADVAAPDRQAEHLAQDLGYLVARDVVHRRDQHTTPPRGVSPRNPAGKRLSLLRVIVRMWWRRRAPGGSTRPGRPGGTRVRWVRCCRGTPGSGRRTPGAQVAPRSAAPRPGGSRARRPSRPRSRRRPQRG